MDCESADRKQGVKTPLGAEVVGFSAKCGLWVILVGVALAWVAVALHFSPWGSGHEAGGDGFWWRGAICGGIAAGVVWLLLGVARRVGTCWFLVTCAGVLLAGQSGLAGLSGTRWRPTNDAAIFTSYLDHLAEHGCGMQSLGALSDQYDYRVWTRRAHPFYLPLRKVAGEHFALATVCFQALLSVLPLFFVWRMASVLLGRKTAVWATILQTVFPFKWIACLELNHHLLGGLYFTAGVWAIVEFFLVRHGWRGKAWLCAVACILVPVMKFEGGIDWVYGVSTWVVVCGLLVAKKLDFFGGAVSLAGLWLLPLLVAEAWVGPAIERIDAADFHHLESGAVAFMARGWVPETGGEYARSHELIDCLTPQNLKKGVQARLLLSQLAYNASEVVFRLFPTKLAKFFLVGFAAGAEEMMNANGALTWGEASKGARILFLLVFLPLVVWGGLSWMPQSGQCRFWPFLAPCVLLAAAYVCTGETSPRYSIYIHALLFVLAGYGAVRLETRQGLSCGWAKESLPAAGAVASTYMIVAVFVIFVAAPKLVPVSCLDARAWPGEGETFVRPRPRSREPFAVELLPRAAGGETRWGPLPLPSVGGKGDNWIAYVFPCSMGLKHAEIADCGRGVEFRELELPACIRLAGAKEAGGRVELKVPFETDAHIVFGYVFRADGENDDVDGKGASR